jgi:hypothetical protein
MSDLPTVYVQNAIAWAQAHLGSREYTTRCLAFVEDAYEFSNQIEVFGGDCAKESADQYEAWRNTQTPPAGAFVFYDCFGPLRDTHRNWGHVGLAIGEGQVIHAWDCVRADGYLDVEEMAAPPGWTKPKYIGWAPVDRIVLGHIVKGAERPSRGGEAG